MDMYMVRKNCLFLLYPFPKTLSLSQASLITYFINAPPSLSYSVVIFVLLPLSGDLSMSLFHSLQSPPFSLLLSPALTLLTFSCFHSWYSPLPPHLSVSMCLCMSVSVPLCLSVSLSVCICPSLSACLSLSTSLSLYLSLSLSLSHTHMHM